MEGGTPTRASSEAALSPSGLPRRGYLDWLRGLAVLIMIEAHLLDSWTRLDDRGSILYRTAILVGGGIGGPLFLFLAGVSVSLSATSRFRRTGDASYAARNVARRGVEIFGLAFLFRLQSCVFSLSPWWMLLKVDILNIMGPTIVAAATMWGWFRSHRGRCIAFAAAALAIAVLTPPVRSAGSLSALPDPVEAYLRPVQGLTNFVIFPWAGFLFAGALPGMLLAATVSRAAERTMVSRIAVAGLALGTIAYMASFLPSPYEQSDFWHSSPSYFLIRTGILTVLIGAAYAWERRPWAEGRFSPLQQLGRTSLFIYWIHVELIYGLVVRPLHHSLSFPAAALSIPVFAGVMLACSIGKEQLVARFQKKPPAPSPKPRAPDMI